MQQTTSRRSHLAWSHRWMLRQLYQQQQKRQQPHYCCCCRWDRAPCLRAPAHTPRRSAGRSRAAACVTRGPLPCPARACPDGKSAGAGMPQRRARRGGLQADLHSPAPPSLMTRKSTRLMIRKRRRSRSRQPQRLSRHLQRQRRGWRPCDCAWRVAACGADGHPWSHRCCRLQSRLACPWRRAESGAALLRRANRCRCWQNGRFRRRYRYRHHYHCR